MGDLRGLSRKENFWWSTLFAQVCMLAAMIWFFSEERFFSPLVIAALLSWAIVGWVSWFTLGLIRWGDRRIHGVIAGIITGIGVHPLTWIFNSFLDGPIYGPFIFTPIIAIRPYWLATIPMGILAGVFTGGYYNEKVKSEC